MRVYKLTLIIAYITTLSIVSVTIFGKQVEGGGKRKSTTIPTTMKTTAENEVNEDDIEIEADGSTFETGWDNSSWNYTKTKKTKSARSTTRILIGAFNIRKFGLPKVSNEPVLDSLVKIITRYDLIAVSEITDRTEKAIRKLMERVNIASQSLYHCIVSPRVGRTNNKEQYALIYRADVIQVKNHFLYDDSEKDPFAREPLIAQLVVKGWENEVALVTIHVKPTDAIAEIDALADVQEWIEKRLKIKDVILLGDFNADCGYVAKKAWKNIRLRNMDKFLWVIPDEEDTTVGKTDCAYDRIVIVGSSIRNSVIPNSAKAFKFDENFNLDEKTALQVSDHYPVEVEFRVSSAYSTNFHARRSASYPASFYVPYIYGVIHAIPAIRNY